MRLSRSALAAGSESSHSVSIGVSMGPGQMALLRTPLGPNCTASDLVSAITAPFDAVYESCGTEQPTNATNEATLMTEPPPESIMAGMPYLQHRYMPLRLTLCTWSHASTGVSITEWS